MRKNIGRGGETKIETELGGRGEPTPSPGVSLAADGERNNSFSFLQSQEKIGSNKHVRDWTF